MVRERNAETRNFEAVREGAKRFQRRSEGIEGRRGRGREKQKAENRELKNEAWADGKEQMANRQDRNSVARDQ